MRGGVPILDITDEAGRLKPLAPIIVAATMLSPTDENRRDQIFATGYTDTVLQVRQAIPPEIAEVTHRGPSVAGISRAAKYQGYLGWIAGQILIFVLRCATHKPEDASLHKAIHIMGPALEREARLQERKFPASTAKLWDGWGKYKSVCHLWAALHILGEGENGLNPENLEFLLNPENLLEFLGTAEFLRSKGENHYARPGHDKAQPLLAPHETWKAPDNLNLPHIAFEAPPLFKHELDWLAEYQAPSNQTD